MDGINKDIYVCCFCANSIERNEQVILNIFLTFEKDESQQLFCHEKCLSEKASSK